jgi:hypothetical protein
VIKVIGSGVLIVVTKHLIRTVKTEKIPRYISATRQNTQLRTYFISAIHG